MVESTLASRWHVVWPIVLSFPLACVYLGVACARPRGADIQVAPLVGAPSSVPAQGASAGAEPLATAPPTAAQSEPPKAPLRTLIIGDSHVFGKFGASLDEALRARSGRQVWTYGSCGSSPMSWLRGMETPCGGYEHVEGKPIRKTLDRYRTPALEGLLRAVRPQRTIVIMGANFLRYSASTAPHVRQLVEILETAGSACTWVGPPEIRDRTATDDEQVRYHKSVERLYRILRTETDEKCTLLDAREMGVRAWDTVDNVHVGPVAAQQWSAGVMLAIENAD
jgi:hypothetical protein